MSRPAEGLYDPAYEHDACGVGFVVDIKGRKSHAIVQQGLTVLNNLLHRGACGAERNTGDGAGILLQMPHEFLAGVCARENIPLPAPGKYGTGLVFLPADPAQARQCRTLFEQVIREEGQILLGWRSVPTDDSKIGPTARLVKPTIDQIFIGRSEKVGSDAAFEQVLYVIRKRVEHAVFGADPSFRKQFHLPSLSAKTLVYKGMLSADQIETFFPELADPSLVSALALVHQRFSTNTFPSWSLAQPFRFLAHNGEINTLRGNRGRMRAREALLASPSLDVHKILPIILDGGSDSANFDNVLELLVMSGRSLPHAILMMIPEAWSGDAQMPPDLRAFYEYHACLMEPWDGPACIAFTDGSSIGAVLDRNGLRPARYYVTRAGLVVMASEVGVLDIPPEDVILKERLHPGRMFLVDTVEGRIVEDAELKKALAGEQPYRRWLRENLIPLESLPPPAEVAEPNPETLFQRQQLFGYTQEDLRLVLAPMAQRAEEPVGSMGNDAALAVLSDRPRMLYDYFAQLFAQVTNPPLDAIREELVTQISTTVGPEKNLLQPESQSCRHIQLKTPILEDAALARIRCAAALGLRSITLPILFRAEGGGSQLKRALDDLFQKADAAIADGNAFLVLSDRGTNAELAPIPALLATAGLHHHLVRRGTRSGVGLIVESGEPREVHHAALLLGYGADAVNPYLAFESVPDLIRRGELSNIDPSTARAHLVKALTKGIVKVMSKMGISTVQSYRGAQIFEALGLDRAMVNEYFTYTSSRIGGIGLDGLAEEARRRHSRAFPDRPVEVPDLDIGGEYQWRRDGEYHLFNPDTVFKLQHATRSGQYRIFREYSEKVNHQDERRCTLRGLFQLKFADQPIPVEEVEPVESIIRRFATGAMSFGSISAEAHETLAIAMNRLGARSNTGEGGEDPARYLRDSNGDWRRSAIKQVASARFGVTSEYLVNATDLQIKMAQGSKPGEGGQIPGGKVSAEIARVRHSTPGVELISPPPHHDIYSIEDLGQLIYDLKNSNPLARIHVKLVAEVGVGTVAAGVSKAHADVVLISGHDGGTGASPLSSIKRAGVPWELGLAETQQVLVMNRLRDRICVQVDGQMKTGRDVVIAALLGAEEYGFATAALVVLGCVMMRVCHLNTCPVGVASQDPELRKKFTGKPEFVETFFRFIAEEVRELTAKLGFRSLDEMIGRVDRLDVSRAVTHWKARGLDLTSILHAPAENSEVGIRKMVGQDHGIGSSLDATQLVPLCRRALEQGEPVELRLPIRNANRTVGTLLGYEVTRRFGAAGLPADTIRIHFKGSAGQSFGAFLPPGISLHLEGDANDYLAKGLSGGRVVVVPPAQSTFVPEQNILVGNVVLYGATSGEAYLRGVAGERFAVRNSGAMAVVEGVGDHGCEYMTGGRVLVLGGTGRNFAAGMSGGIAYVLDATGDFDSRCNTAMVELEALALDQDIEEVQGMLRDHLLFTGSALAMRILENFAFFQWHFVKVTPRDYKKALRVGRSVETDAEQWRRVANG
jgi:glutamate synthase (ferredoxin)